MNSEEIYNIKDIQDIIINYKEQFEDFEYHYPLFEEVQENIISYITDFEFRIPELIPNILQKIDYIMEDIYNTADIWNNRNYLYYKILNISSNKNSIFLHVTDTKANIYMDSITIKKE